MVVGGFCLVIAMVPVPLYGFEQFGYPKELVLHGIALAVTMRSAGSREPIQVTAIDLCLGLFVVLGVIGAVAMPTNRWLAVRALALTLSSVVLFRRARQMTEDGHAGTIMLTLCVMAGAAALGVLGEAFDVTPPLSQAGRGPGGALGNRNMAAHVLVLLGPTVALVGITTRRSREVGWSAGLLALVAWAVVLSRSRGAWVAALASAAIASVCWMASRRAYATRHPVESDRRVRVSRRRLAVIGTAVAVGIAVGISDPAGFWGSSAAYRDTWTRLLDSQTGSGLGRVIQYQNTAAMWRAHPLFGVGAGNWSVIYPRFATPGDPSYHPTSAYEVPRVPNSDMLNTLAEQGAIGFTVLLAAFVILLVRVSRALVGGHQETMMSVPHALTIVSTVAAALVVSVVDYGPATLAVPAMVMALVMGSLTAHDRPTATLPRGSAAAALRAVRSVLLLIGFGVSLINLTGGVTYIRAATREAAAKAADLSPGDYQLQFAVGLEMLDAGNCEQAQHYLRRAQALFPNNRGPRSALNECTQNPRNMMPGGSSPRIEQR